MKSSEFLSFRRFLQNLDYFEMLSMRKSVKMSKIKKSRSKLGFLSKNPRNIDFLGNFAFIS